jgi:hypothetical protein
MPAPSWISRLLQKWGQGLAEDVPCEYQACESCRVLDCDEQQSQSCRMRVRGEKQERRRRESVSQVRCSNSVASAEDAQGSVASAVAHEAEPPSTQRSSGNPSGGSSSSS